jgi:hypothetical protein
MGGDVLSGGVVFALAAALWLAYLVPTWLRRREYLATERNAVRLQQTLRILAETAEVPQEVRVEATARDVAIQQRILRKEEERARAEAKARAEAEAAAMRARAAAIAAESTVTAAPRIALAPDVAQDRARRLRRVRAATSLLMLIGLGVVVYGGFDLLASGSWIFLAGGTVLTASALVLLSRLAKAGRMRRVAAVFQERPVQSELFDHAEHDVAVPAATATWTPQPLPKPLYLSRGSAAASAMASVDAAVALRRAAAREDLERRAAELAPRLEPEVAQLKPRTAAAVAGSEPAASAGPARTVDAPPSRFARMGVLDDVESDALDLDAVLRRRRAAG